MEFEGPPRVFIARLYIVRKIYHRVEPREPLFPFFAILTNRFSRIGLAISFRRVCAPGVRRYIPVRTDSEKPIVILCHSWLSRNPRGSAAFPRIPTPRSACSENNLFIARRASKRETVRNGTSAEMRLR